MSCTGIILGAGLGTRLKDLTKDKPKILMEVNGKTILEHMVNFVKAIGVDSIMVVTGYFAKQVDAEAQKIDPNIITVFNPDYARYQNLVSLECALKAMPTGDFIMCNGDYTNKDYVAPLIKKNQKGVTIFGSFDIKGTEEDVMKIKLDAEGNLADMSKQLANFEAIYTGDFFCEEAAVVDFKKAIECAYQKHGREKAVTERTFPELISLGHTLRVVDIGPATWCEIDTPEELEQARKRNLSA